MCFGDRSIHARRESEIIRIDNQPPHAASLAGWEIVISAMQNTS
jgi:hypothetical protein